MSMIARNSELVLDQVTLNGHFVESRSFQEKVFNDYKQFAENSTATMSHMVRKLDDARMKISKK